MCSILHNHPQCCCWQLWSSLIGSKWTLWRDEWFFLLVTFPSHHTHLQLSFICFLSLDLFGFLISSFINLFCSFFVYFLFSLFSLSLCSSLSQHSNYHTVCHSAGLVMTPNHKLHTSHERTVCTHSQARMQYILPKCTHTHSLLTHHIIVFPLFSRIWRNIIFLPSLLCEVCFKQYADWIVKQCLKTPSLRCFWP